MQPKVPSSTSTTISAARWFAMVTAYVGLSIWVTWPLALNWLTHVPGPSNDALLHYWNSWWVRQSLLVGRSPFFTDLLFAPDGVSLITHNIPWFHSIPAAALSLIWSPVASYNAALLLNLVACAVAMFFLAHRLTQNGAAAFIAGVIYLTWPFRLSQLDHPNMLATFAIPLFFYFLIKLLAGGRSRSVLWCGITFALVGISRWQHLIAVVPMGVVFVMTTSSLWWSREWRQTLSRLSAAALIGLLFLAPAIGLLAVDQWGNTASDSLLRPGEESIMQTDLLAYVTPSRDHRWLADWSRPLYDRYYPQRTDLRRFSAYIGLTTLVLALWGARQQGRCSWPWITMAIMLLLFAMGPVWRINGVLIDDQWTPYQLVAPLLRFMRVPDRFNMYLALPMAILAAYGIAAAWNRLPQFAVPSRVIGIVATGGVFALVLFETAQPAPMWALQPRADIAVAFGANQGAVINLPIDALQAKSYMFDQTFHGRPLSQGNLSRIPTRALDFINLNPLLGSLASDQEIPAMMSAVSLELDQLAAAGIEDLVINKTLVGADRVAHWRRFFPYDPHYENEIIAVYDTQPARRQGMAFETNGTTLDFGVLKRRLSKNCFDSHSPLAVDIAWGSQVGVPLDTVIQFRLDELAPFAEQPIWPGRPTDAAPNATIFWGHYVLWLPENNAPGSYQLWADLKTSGDQTPIPAVDLGAVIVQPDGCTFAEHAEWTAAEVVFGEQIRLQATNLVLDNQRLGLDLEWFAEQRMDVDYTVFIHVFDPATDVPVAQADIKPRNGNSRTQFWWPGDRVIDHVDIWLNDVPTGTYGVAIGLYDPQTGARLVAVTPDGDQAIDGRYIIEPALTLARSR